MRPQQHPASSAPRNITACSPCAASDETWRKCEQMLAAACFTHQLGSPTSVLPSGPPPRAGGEEACCCEEGDADTSEHCAAPDCCTRAESIARRLHRREYASPGDFAADVAALFVAAKSRGGASARWAGEAELDFQCLWRAAGLGQPSRSAAPADAGSPRRSDALQRVPRLSASGTLKLASSLGATGFAHDADAAGADSRWAAA